MALLRSVWQKLVGKNAAVLSTNGTIATPINTAKPQLPAMHTVPEKYLPLWHLQNQRQMLEVRIEGSSLAHQTLIMAMDIERGLLWLDDLFPLQPLLEIGDTITIKHHKLGEQLSFTAEILAWGDSFGVRGFAVPLPDNAHYAPRRQSRRADLSQRPSLQVKVRTLGHEITYGTVQDISSGGLRFNIAGNLLSQFRHGALLPLCELDLGDNLHIVCTARVRAFRLLRTPYRHTQVSIEFMDLTGDRLAQLKQFINNLIYLSQHPVIENRRRA